MYPVFVFVLASRHHRHLNVGVTADLAEGIGAQRAATERRLGKRFVLQKLVYVEALGDIEEAFQREEALNQAGRLELVRLITRVNPGWDSISVSQLLRAGFAR